MRKLIWIFKALVILGLSVAIFGSAGYFAYQLFVVPNRIPPEEALGGPPTPPPDPSLPELKKLLALHKEGKLAEAQSGLLLFLDRYPYSTGLDAAKAALGEINVSLFFTPGPGPYKVRYEVVRGDALAKIERKLKSTQDLIMRCNNLTDPRRLSVGQVLYVPQVQFALTIDRKRQTVTLTNHHRFFKEYKALSWAAPAPQGNGPAAPVASKVRDVLAWQEGRRVLPTSADYQGSARWVDLTTRGFTFYTEGGPKPPGGGGIAFTQKEMEELSTLLRKNDPVSIQ